MVLGGTEVRGQRLLTVSHRESQHQCDAQTNLTQENHRVKFIRSIANTCVSMHRGVLSVSMSPPRDLYPFSRVTVISIVLISYTRNSDLRYFATGLNSTEADSMRNNTLL